MSFDVRHHVVLSAVYDLPVGQGKSVRNELASRRRPGCGRLDLLPPACSTFQPVRRSSSLARIRQASSTPACAPTGSATVQTLSSPEMCEPMGSLISTPRVSPHRQSATLGASGRSPINGPGVNNWDLGLEKTFTVKEQTRLRIFAVKCLQRLQPRAVHYAHHRHKLRRELRTYLDGACAKTDSVGFEAAILNSNADHAFRNKGCSIRDSCCSPTIAALRSVWDGVYSKEQA